MGWIVAGVIAVAVGATIGNTTYTNDANAAREEADRVIDDARDSADLELARLEAQLDAQVGQLGDDFETYDDWYNAQTIEYNDALAAGTFTGSLEDYVREELVTDRELGQYGLERAQLESQVAIARRRVELAREDAAAQYGFAERQFDEGTIASNRIVRNEAAAAAAMGIKSGTPMATVAENQRVRMEELNLFMDEATQRYTNTTSLLDVRSGEITDARDFGLSGLSGALTGARTSYDFAVDRIELDFEQYEDAVNANYDLNFNANAELRATLSGGLAGASMVFSTFTTGASVGAWGYDADGAFWSFLNSGGN